MAGELTRRQFFKVCAAGMAGSSLAALGFSPTAALAEVREFKLLRTTETRNTCPYCSVGCGIIMYSLGDKAKNAEPSIIHIEGDPDHPVNRGTLCPKGAGLLDFVHSPNRLKYPEYRAPGSNEWKRISWDEAFDRIARLMKDDRDKNFVAKNADGATVNRWLTTGFLAASASSNETGYITHKVDPQPRHARIRQPGACLTRPYGGKSCPYVRPRRDDQSLGRHQERQPDPDHGRQRRRGPPLRLQVGDRGQGPQQGHAHRGRPALHPLGGGGGLSTPRSAPAPTSPSWAG